MEQKDWLDYYKQYIGKKYGKLKILNFYYENSIPMVKCLCNCGQECVKKWKSVKHGDIKTCGNHKLKSKKNLSVAELYPKIISKYWDYEKNNINPKELSILDEGEYWWKGYDKSYLMPLALLKQKKGGTSYPEQAIIYFLKKSINDVQNRVSVYFNNKKCEIDIFIPSLMLGIEYDGCFFHKEKQEEELWKNQALKTLNIKLIRVRERGLPSTNLLNGIEILQNEKEKEDEFIIRSVNLIIDFINENYGLSLKKFCLDNINKSRKFIYQQYLPTFDKNSICFSWLSKWWSDENEMPPYYVYKNTIKRYIFRCNKNYKLESSPYSLNAILKNISKKKKFFKENLLINDSYGLRCPFVWDKKCPANTYSHINNYKKCEFFKCESLEEVKEDLLCRNTSKKEIEVGLSFYKKYYNFKTETEYMFKYYFEKIIKYETNEISDILYQYIKKYPEELLVVLKEIDKVKEYYLSRLLSNKEIKELYFNYKRKGI